VILALSLADLDPSCPVFDTSQGPVLIVAGEAALAEDNQKAAAVPAAPTEFPPAFAAFLLLLLLLLWQGASNP